MPKNIKDINMINCHPVILNYLCKKMMLIVISCKIIMKIED